MPFLWFFDVNFMSHSIQADTALLTEFTSKVDGFTFVHFYLKVITSYEKVGHKQEKSSSGGITFWERLRDTETFWQISFQWTLGTFCSSTVQMWDQTQTFKSQASGTKAATTIASNVSLRTFPCKLDHTTITCFPGSFLRMTSCLVPGLSHLLRGPWLE